MAEEKDRMQAEMPEETKEETMERTEETVGEKETPKADETEQEQTTDEPDAGGETEEKQEDREEPRDGGKEKKERFGKKKKEKKDKKDELIEELTDRVKRQMAEFDNFRKRTEKEKSHMYEVGAKEVIEKILPVVDNFERGLDSVPEAEQEDPFVEGMNKIYKQLLTTLEELGVKPIEAVGCEFDPNLHNAVMHVEDEELGDNVVAEELLKGYTYRDSVVRHSMVKVAN